MKKCIITICNDKYEVFGTTLLNSFYINNPNFDGDFIFLYDDVLVKMSESFKKHLLTIRPDVLFKKIDSKFYQHLYTEIKEKQTNISGIISLLKYEIFTMFEYDKILLLDSDIIINDNIEDIFNSNAPIGIVKDPIANTDQRVVEKERPRMGGEYFNTGVILVNTVFIPSDFKKKLLETLTEKTRNNFFLCLEQDILNIFSSEQYNEKIFLLPTIYNTLISYKNPIAKFPYINSKEGKILHFISKYTNTIISDYNEIEGKTFNYFKNIAFSYYA